MLPLAKIEEGRTKCRMKNQLQLYGPTMSFWLVKITNVNNKCLANWKSLIHRIGQDLEDGGTNNE